VRSHAQKFFERRKRSADNADAAALAYRRDASQGARAPQT